jgi:uracil-DNA glycosylase
MNLFFMTDTLKLQDLIQNGWKNVLKSCFDENWMTQLEAQLLDEYTNHTIFPPFSSICKALELTSFDAVKVVIIGQDPYHGVGEAQGFSFSVPNGVKMPPSLRNICKELMLDLGIERTQSDLTDWANQGVLLLNSVLTVRANEPGSHAKIGWQSFTTQILQHLNAREKPIVFMLWGSYAQQMGKNLDDSKHLIIRSAHPSPLAANRGRWFGSKPFSQANAYLAAKGMDPIRWA